MEVRGFVWMRKCRQNGLGTQSFSNLCPTWQEMFFGLQSGVTWTISIYFHMSHVFRCWVAGAAGVSVWTLLWSAVGTLADAGYIRCSLQPWQGWFWVSQCHVNRRWSCCSRPWELHCWHHQRTGRMVFVVRMFFLLMLNASLEFCTKC